MKRWIKAAENNDVIFEDDNFKFVHREGIGMKDTPWKGLEVKTKQDSPAYKHVVRIDLNRANSMNTNGEPFEYKYSDATVSHGIRGVVDTLDDTREYITVLRDAVAFCEDVNRWLEVNQ